MNKKITLERALYLICIGLLVYMPFHLFLSRWLSLYTGGLGQWDGAKDVITAVALVLSIFLGYKHKLYKAKWFLVFFVLSAVYFFLHISYYLLDKNSQDSRSFAVATLFNGRIIAYFFIAAVVSATSKVNLRKIFKFVVIASAITCLFAVIQYFSPPTLMSNFGYSVDRGAKPNFFIDDKPDFPRVMSTIRDPNSYGAYLILPIVTVGALLMSSPRKKKVLATLLLHMAALLLTFSRGAWLGLSVALAVFAGLTYGKRVLSIIKKHTVPILAIFSLVVCIGISARNTYVFQNLILHSDQSTVQADPNELRVELTQRAVRDIAEDPEGHGPGTAGLASIGNPNGSYLTENYFLQIGYEVGLFGLGIFITLLSIILIRLTVLKERKFSLIMLASAGGYVFVSTLIHLWSNESVAAQWWILAGLVLGPTLRNRNNT